MPKLGRRSELSELESRWAAMTSRNAPFGTGDTPQTRMRIVAGKPVYVPENDAGHVSPRASQASSPTRTSPTRHLVPITEKPNNVNPHAYSPNRPSPGFTSAQKDSHNSHIHGALSRESTDLNPHKVIPPIQPPNGEGTNKYVLQREPVPAAVDFSKYLPPAHSGTYLPNQPITLSKDEELELRRRLKEEMEGFDLKQLKDTYCELAGFDTNLSGEITFPDLSFTLMRRKMHVSADLLRVAAALYITQPGKINYEKVLCFLMSSLQDTATLNGNNHDQKQRTHSVASDVNPAPARGQQKFNPLTQEENSEPSESGSISGGKDAKLLKMVQMQMASSADDLDMSRIWQTFQSFDRGQRGMLSDAQIKSAACLCRIPLQESIINQIINRCDSSNGQYRWQQFVAFIERVAPGAMVTGLPIPKSKRPLEYAKQYPEPSKDWPRISPRRENPNQPASGRPTPQPQPNNGQPDHTNHNQAQQREQNGGRRETQQPQPTKPPPPRTPTIPDKDPNDDLPLSHPRLERLNQIEDALQRQAKIEEMERQLRIMETEYAAQKKKIMEQQETEQQKKEKLAPWLDRFMKMANAMYGVDAHNTGYLARKEATWLANQYNINYDLGIPQLTLDNALQRAQDGDRIAIDPFLRMISMQGP